MTDWTHKRLIEKLDRVQEQRDMLLMAAQLFFSEFGETLKLRLTITDKPDAVTDQELKKKNKQLTDALNTLLGVVEKIKAEDEVQP